jgi:competence protein ComEA
VGPAASTVHEPSALKSGAHLVPAGVGPRGDEGGGLGCEPPAARPSWHRRTRVAFENSVWAPVALKLIGLALGMLALAGVGVASILSGVGGVQVPLAGMLGSDIHAAWLASKPTANASAQPRAAHAAGALAASAAPTAGGLDTSAPVSAATAHALAPEGVDRANAGSTSSPAGSTSSTAPSTGMTEDGKVILNQANAGDLRHLPGVGQKRADAILALRTRLGRFKQVSDLLRVKGIGVRGLKKLLPHVVLDAPKPSV